MAKPRSGEIQTDDDVMGKLLLLALLFLMFLAPARQTVVRRRGESPESKKARKAAVKADRAVRRIEKRAAKGLFENEYQKQTKIQAARDIERRIRKL